jgi:hypothetical protein
MFGLKSKPEVKDTFVRLLTSRVEQRPNGDHLASQVGDIVAVGKKEAQRMAEAYQAVECTAAQSEAFRAGYIEWDAKRNHWALTPSGITTLSRPGTTKELRAKIEAAIG